jgi:hypothetical protein
MSNTGYIKIKKSEYSDLKRLEQYALQFFSALSKIKNIKNTSQILKKRK